MRKSQALIGSSTGGVALRTFFFSVIAFALSSQAVFAVDPGTFANPLNNSNKPYSLADVVGVIVRGVLGITGVLAAVFIILGGVRIIFAGGNEEQVAKGKATLLWAFLGMVIAFMGYLAVSYILSLSANFPGLSK